MSCNSHSRLRPKKRVSAGSMSDSQRRLVRRSSTETQPCPKAGGTTDDGGSDNGRCHGRSGRPAGAASSDHDGIRANRRPCGCATAGGVAGRPSAILRVAPIAHSKHGKLHLRQLGCTLAANELAEADRVVRRLAITLAADHHQQVSHLHHRLRSSTGRPAPAAGSIAPAARTCLHRVNGKAAMISGQYSRHVLVDVFAPGRPQYSCLQCKRKRMSA